MLALKDFIRLKIMLPFLSKEFHACGINTRPIDLGTERDSCEKCGTGNILM
jgi:hypothetical protein